MNLKIFESTPNPRGKISERMNLLTKLYTEINASMLRVSSETQKYKNKKLYTFNFGAFVSLKRKNVFSFFNVFSFILVFLISLIKRDIKHSGLLRVKVIHVIYHERTKDKIKCDQVINLLFNFYNASPVGGDLKKIKFNDRLLSIKLDNYHTLYFPFEEKYFECKDFIQSVQRELFSKPKT